MIKRFAGLVVVLAAAGGGYWLGLRGTPAPAPQASVIDGVVQDNSGKRVLYWHDPMVPQQRFQKPGKSPFMDMMLVPVYAEAGAEQGQAAIKIDPRVVQNLGVRTAVAELGTLERRLEAVGGIEYNERAVVLVQTRAAGFVERVHARAPLDAVKRGAPLVELLVPEWVAAQHEFLFLLSREAGAELVAASRERLRLAGMSEADIEAVERDRAPRARITIESPIDGVIAELGVREGMTVMPGATLYRLVDLGTVWVSAEIPEAQAALVRPGSRVEATVAGWPGEVFRGSVGAILPELDTATRTLRARIELANPGHRLKPGMFATLVFAPVRGTRRTIVPADAVIETGMRKVVILTEGEGRFRPVEVETGVEADGRVEVVKGVKAGEKVVVSGQFLIDSEASLKGTLARLADSLHRGTGKVEEIVPGAGEVVLAHDPMPSMQWPAMTMPFRVEDRAALAALKKGDAVEFEMKSAPDKAGDWVIVRIMSIGRKGAKP